MIIGLTGYAGSGKSTAAAVLVDLGWSQRKFAAPLKAMLRAMLDIQGVPPDVVERMIEGDLKERCSVMLGGKTPRHAMQALGTEWGRMRLADSIWIEAAMRTVDSKGLTVFDDCRFPNEAEAIRVRGGVVVRIERPGVGPINGHVSEVLVEPDFTIFNEDGVTDLREKMRLTFGPATKTSA